MSGCGPSVPWLNGLSCLSIGLFVDLYVLKYYILSIGDSLIKFKQNLPFRKTFL